MWGALKARRTDLQPPMIYWRGRGAGGSSSVNGQIAIRGMLDDFDLWASEGCAGWSGAEVLPYFIKLEDDLDFGNEPYHGRGGPIPVMRTPQEEWGGVDKALRDACLALGYGWCADHNAPTGTGVSPYAMNRRHGARARPPTTPIWNRRASAPTSPSSAMRWSTASSSMDARQSRSGCARATDGSVSRAAKLFCRRARSIRLRS